MAKPKNATKKLLDMWLPPEGAGDPIGCVATTFTFSAALFEEECLARFLGMESNAQEDGSIYLIEREEKLVNLTCAAVLADARHCRGKRSLRWDLLPIRVSGAAQHAKLSLLVWQKAVRLIVTSANLTDDGYRRNQETAGTVDFKPEGGSDPAHMRAITKFLRDMLKLTSGPSVGRVEKLLLKTDNLVRGWKAASGPIRTVPLLIGPGRDDLFTQFLSAWPDSSPPYEAHVLSPFFDVNGTENEPAKKLWATLRQRGKASVTYHVSAALAKDGERLALAAPQNLKSAAPSSRSDICQEFARVLEDRPSDSGPVFRPLHAKQLRFENDRQISLIQGSSNFTSKGCGLATKPNFEANLLYLVSQKEAVSDALAKAFLRGEPLDENEVALWQPPSDETGDNSGPIALPALFKDATLRRDEDGGYRLELGFDPKAKPPSSWKLFPDDGDGAFFGESDWVAQGSPERISIKWLNLQPPSGLEVSWQGSQERAWWPVNIINSDALPPPDELKNLTLDALISILTSALPLRESMRQWLRRSDQQKEHLIGEPIPELDPHKRVDTSQFLLQRVRRTSWALRALRERIERPAATDETISWRLYGPVGAEAVLNAIERECRFSDPAEKAFLIAELALELSRAEPRSAEGALSPKRVKANIREYLVSVAKRMKLSSSNAPATMRRYLNNVKKEIG